MTTLYVQPDKLLPHALNAKVYGKGESLEPDFVESVRVNGVHTPVAVVANGTMYTVISGHRRVLAAGRVGRPVPINVLEDAGSLWQESFLLECNRQREKTPEQKTREFTELKRIEAALAQPRMLAATLSDPQASPPHRLQRRRLATKLPLKSA